MCRKGERRRRAKKTWWEAVEAVEAGGRQCSDNPGVDPVEKTSKKNLQLV